MREHDPRYPAFLLTLPEEQGSRLVGCAGLGPKPEGDAELGYWIARPYWGRGFATEGARGVLEVARLLGHRRIVGRHFLDNPASGKVLRKLGFIPTGEAGMLQSCGRADPSPSVSYMLDLEADEMPAQAA